MRNLLLCAAVGALVSAMPASAEDLAETATRFGTRQSVTGVAISPSGDKLLFIEPGRTSDETVYVVDLTSQAPPTPILTVNEPNARMPWCAWGTEERIVCELYGLNEVQNRVLSWTRLMSMKSDGTDVARLTPRGGINSNDGLQNGGRLLALDVDGEPGHVLMSREVDELSAYGRTEGLAVSLVDLTNGRGKVVERANKMASGYIADEHGDVRIMRVSDISGGYDGNDVRYLYRKKGESDWEPLSAVDATSDLAQGFRPVAVDSDKDVAYGFERVDGFDALFQVSLDGSMTKTLLKARDDVDVDGLVRIGRSGRVIGVSYATDRRLVEYFDPEFDRLAAGLSSALPGTPQISILDASADESEIVIAASSDTDPGTVYLFEKDTNALGELFPLRAPLAGREMGEMQSVSFTASDGTSIPAYLTLPPGSDGKGLPAVVMPHGGPGSRDVWGFDWLAQFLAARGYAVLQPNFRGSAGYGEAWFGRNGYKEWPVAIGDVVDAGRWLASEGIADSDRMAIMGWSYGGYAALQSQAVAPDLYQAVVAIAPVTDLELLVEENRYFTSYEWYRKRVGTGPHVVQGSPARRAESFAAPVMLVHGSMDINVSDAHSELMKDRLESAGKPVEYLEFEGLDHSLVHSQARSIMLRKIGEFLDANVGS